MIVETLLVRSWLPGTAHRAILLRMFGAQVGRHVTLKPGLRVKFPWRLRIDDWVWLGDDVWIDNLAAVEVRVHSVVSQGVYICTGNHDWSRDDFKLVVRPVAIGPHAWVCARATLAPGTVVGEGTIVGLGAVADGALRDWTIYKGNPAREIGPRLRVKDDDTLKRDAPSR